MENTCSALLDVWPDDRSSTEIVPEPNCSDEIPNFPEIVPEPNCSDEIPNFPEIVPEPNCSDEIPNFPEIVPEPNCSDEIPNFPEIVPEPNCSDEIPNFPEIVPEPNCSDEIPNFPEIVPEPNCSDEIPNSIIPEPNCSDASPNSQQVSASTCSDKSTNPLPILELDRSDENVNSPHKQVHSYMNIYTNSRELPAPLGADEITASPQEVSNVTGMSAPLGTPHHDLTTWNHQILSNCRHESIWQSSTTYDESPNNVDFPAHHGPNTDNIFSSHSSFTYNQDTYLHNPDQVAHTLYPSSFSSQRDLDTVDKGIVSDTNLTERPLTTEQPLCLSVSLPEISDLPGFATLNQEEVKPPAMTDDANLPWTPSETAMANCSSSPSIWYTPPQTPSPEVPEINAMASPASLPPGSLYVIGSIFTRTSQMLVDTGASVTAVSSSFFSSLPSRPQLQPSTLFTIRTVSGEELLVQGQTTFTLTLDAVPYVLEVLVIDNLTYPVVLGRDFLMRYGSVIDMKANTLVLSGNPPIPLHHSPGLLGNASKTPESVTVHANATFILAPLSESVIPVYPKTPFPVGSTGLIEPSSNLAERYHVCGASQLVSLSQDNTFPIRVLNPTNKPVTIYRCSTMGTYTPSGGSMSVITTPDSPPPASPTSRSTQHVPLDLSDTILTEAQQEQLQSLVAEYRDIFALTPEELGRTGLVRHRIETGDNPPIRQRPYRVSEAQRGIIEEHVTDMLNRGIIQPSVSPWSSPIILVKKKDGTDRFVIDYRRLNSVTRKDSYPLPRIDDALDALNGTKFFSSMDLMSGYWQVEMEPGSREHTAFVTYGGLYEFQVLPFGLTGAPSTYQRLMECVLRNLTYKICLIYLDDILVYSRTFEDHLCHLRQVFDRLRHANLRLKPSKCNFACPQVKYLGHVVSPEGIAPDDDKISAVRDFPRPHNVKTVRSFLGLANYYRRFIKDFAKIASPLNQLLRKDHKFVWTDSCEQAFKALKDALISAPILAFPDFTEQFHLYTDASNEGLGVTLGQIQNNREVAIAYAGRDLNAAEKNYSTTEREALAVIFGIKKFEPYLYGRKFILHTDHHSLKWLMSISDPSGRLARWSLLVQQYDFEIKHRPGAVHGNADALSRRQYATPSLTISAYDVPGVQTERVRDFQRRDPDLADLIQYLESSKLPTSHKSARKSVFTLISTKVFVCICLNSRARTKIMIWNRRA